MDNLQKGERLARATDRFPLGALLMTRQAALELDRQEALQAIEDHARGDWGLVCSEDRQANEDALRDGDRVMSVYRSSKGQRFWIITEADRSATTVLFPDEY